MPEDELESELERRKLAQQRTAAVWGIGVIVAVIVAIFVFVPLTGTVAGLFG